MKKIDSREGILVLWQLIAYDTEASSLIEVLLRRRADHLPQIQFLSGKQQPNIIIILIRQLSGFMSLLLLEQQEMDRSALKNYYSLVENRLKHAGPPAYANNVDKIEEETRRLHEGVARGWKETKQWRELMVLVGWVKESYQVALRVKIARHRPQTEVTLHILTPTETYFHLPNSRSVSQISLRINGLLGKHNSLMLRLSFNPNTGRLAASLPVYSFSDRFLEGLSNSRCFSLDSLYKSQVEQCLPVLGQVIKETMDLPPSFARENHNYFRVLENIARYSSMLLVGGQYNQSRMETEQEIVDKERQRRNDVRRVMNGKVSLEPWMKQLSSIYQHRLFFNQLVPRNEENFMFSNEEVKYIRAMLAMPMQPKHKNPLQNNMVLNHVFVHDLIGLKLTKIGEGGFSNIYRTQMKYSYVYSTQGCEPLDPQQSDISSAKALRKIVVIKQQESQLDFSRNKHEIQVLKQIKNGSSIFLPKYYLIANKPNPYNTSVVLDFLPFKNLKEHMRSSWRWMSLISKVFLSFSILQGLRYIRDYRIVHLDLKPNNIMLYCNLLIKLIDFGQSYHPKVCETKHKPGFTVPYSPPQVYNHKRQPFSSKSDVFSFGVLLFEILYNSYPYDILQPTEIIDWAMRNYLQKWYFTPQQYETYGSHPVLRILNGLISRCLSPDPDQRPELDWLAVIIKLCLELLH